MACEQVKEITTSPGQAKQKTVKNTGDYCKLSLLVDKEGFQFYHDSEAVEPFNIAGPRLKKW